MLNKTIFGKNEELIHLGFQLIIEKFRVRHDDVAQEAKKLFLFRRELQTVENLARVMILI